MGFCVLGPTPLSDGLASTVSLSLSLLVKLQQGPPLLLMSSFRRRCQCPLYTDTHRDLLCVYYNYYYTAQHKLSLPNCLFTRRRFRRTFLI